MSRWRARIVLVLTVFPVLGASAPALAQTSLDKLAEASERLKPSPPRYIKNMKFGVRGVTFTHLAVAPSDRNTVYATSADGFVYASHDGGLTWEEGRLITQRVKFFGAIRPSAAPNGAGFAGRVAYAPTLTPTRAWDIPFSVAEYLNDTERGGITAGASAPGLDLPELHLQLRDSGGGGGGGGDASKFGVGNVRAAPRLQSLLRKRGARLIGLNLKLMINTRGLEPTMVNHVAIHPTNPNIAYVGTGMGLFMTRDGGTGWVDGFNGRNPLERWVHFVAFDPSDTEKIWIGTRQGLLFSTDSGNRFQRVSGTQLSSLNTLWLEFHPKHPNIVYAGSTNGVFRSDDGGRNWRWIFYETLPAANVIRGIALDPQDPDRVQLGTQDGMYRSPDGGKTWQRSGGFLFTSQWVTRVIADPVDSNHLICTTWLNVWETFDWGQTWSAMYINDSDWSPRMVMFDPQEKGVFWVVTSSEILKLTPTPPKQPNPGSIAELRRQIASEPSLAVVMEATFRVHSVQMGWHIGKRINARYSHLLPNIHLFGGYVDYRLTGGIDSAELGSDIFPGGGLGGGASSGLSVIENTVSWKLPYYGGLLTWDLSSVLFHGEEPPYGRVFDQSNAIYNRLKYEVQRLFEERRRVLIQLITSPPQNVGALLTLRFRLEELTAHLNLMSGGLYESQLQQLENTPWVQ